MDYRIKLDNCDMIVSEMNLHYYKSQGWKVVEEIQTQSVDTSKVTAQAQARVLELMKLKKEEQLELIKALGCEVTTDIARASEEDRIKLILKLEKGN